MKDDGTSDGAALVWCPFPDREAAHAAASALLAEKLIACANILPGVESVFEWQGKISSSNETAVLFKTTGNTLAQLIARLGELHPYDTPAIVGWHCDAADPKALDWLRDTIGTQ